MAPDVHWYGCMQCKKCKARISYALAAETLAVIKNTCDEAGMSHEEVCHYAAQNGPLCRQCIQAWGAQDVPKSDQVGKAPGQAR